MFRNAIVTELVGFGARVHTCSRDGNELERCLNGWVDGGYEVTGSVCDVSIREEREKLMGTVSSAFDGKLNILVIIFAHYSISCSFSSHNPLGT